MNELNEGPPKAPRDKSHNMSEGSMAHDSGGAEASASSDPSSGTATTANSQSPCPMANKENSTVEYVYGIRSPEGGKINDYYWNDVRLKVGQRCVAENEYGEFLGTVEFTRHPIMVMSCKRKKIGKIVRSATDADLEKYKSLAKKEKTARGFCREKIQDRELPMSLTRVHYIFDGSKAIFFFTAESRVDFRELVKDLVTYTRVKVEMRQIGVRDEARMLGGCGPCGTELCCSSFMSDFLPVSIKMAKNQNLSLNPTKISGVCGRLMCCLAFENSHYVELQKHSPKMGKSVITPDGSVGRVCHLNLIKEKATVIFDDDSKQEFSTRELTRNIGGQPARTAPKPAPGRTPSPARTPDRGGRQDKSSKTQYPAKKTDRQKPADETRGKERIDAAVKDEGETKRRRRRRRRKRMPGPSEESRSSTDAKAQSTDKPALSPAPPPRAEQKNTSSGDSGGDASQRFRRRKPRSRDRSRKRRRDPGSEDKK
ncbi:Stage 0 sporulation protein YaaT [hydrothermal vent metagenome]|uniref:Stage 0 sporulation protein YaaT n=1 Tax=hydrothermal vent metagenome TaxID=652676 RepID=A0A3B1BWH8_9ZZZZ